VRTTLTLDDDLARELREEARRTGRHFKEVVNETIRRGLVAGAPPGRRPKRFRVRPVPGRFRPGIDLMRLNRLVDELEIERARALVIRDR